MTVYSFRRVLKVNRHIHAVSWGDKVRVLPVPVPLLGLAYFAVLETVFWVVSRLPVFRVLTDWPYHTWFVVPFVATYLLMTSEFDGRQPHLWVRSWITYWLRPHCTRAGIQVPAPTGRSGGRQRWWHDEYAPTLHRSRITEPSTVRFEVPVRFSLGWRGRFIAHHDPDGHPQEHEVADRLEIRP